MVRTVLALWGCLLTGAAGRAAADGAVDPSFLLGGGNNGGLDGDAFAAAVQPDGRIVVGGYFTKVGRTSRAGIARLTADGLLDATFDPGAGADDLVESVALQPDGRVLLVGRFSTVDGVLQPFLARLNADGRIDTGFRPQLDSLVSSCAVQPDGRILVAGNFTTINGVSSRYVARLLPDGTLDPGFVVAAGPSTWAQCMVLQPDGRVVIGGGFTSVQGTPRIRVARLNPNGSLDATFDPGMGADAAVAALAVAGDGRLLVGGRFTTLGGQPRVYLGRLNGDGSLDASFTPGIGLSAGGLLAIRVAADGAVIVGGEFSKVDGVPRNCLARLLATGALDTTFDPGAGPDNDNDRSGLLPMIRGLELQPDGRLLVAGRFTGFDGVDLNRLARLSAQAGGTVEFEFAELRVSEDAGEYRVPVIRHGTSTGPVSVSVAAVSGTATPSADYLLASSAVVFAAGEVRQTLGVSIASDGIPEGDETVVLRLGAPAGGVQVGAVATLTLTLQDGTHTEPPRLTSAVPLPGGGLLVTATAGPGVLALEVSENLREWSAVETNDVIGGEASFETAVPAGPAQLFWRARQ